MSANKFYLISLVSLLLISMSFISPQKVSGQGWVCQGNIDDEEGERDDHEAACSSACATSFPNECSYGRCVAGVGCECMPTGCAWENGYDGPFPCAENIWGECPIGLDCVLSPTSAGFICVDKDGEIPDGGSPPGPPSTPDISIKLGERFDVTGLVTNLYSIFLPAAVVLGIILIVRAGYIFMTSQGDPRRVGEGKEGLTAAIMGLLFVVLSIALLRIIIGSFITGGGAGF